jgi:hypothetical protein
VGPGAVLTNLVKSCLKRADRTLRDCTATAKDEHGLTSLWHGLAQLAVSRRDAERLDRTVEGVAVRRRPAAAASTPKAGRYAISGVNYAKPYPPTNGAAGLRRAESQPNVISRLPLAHRPHRP